MPIDTYDTHEADGGESGSPRARPYIGVLFECCGVYARVYRQPDSQLYQGRCPRCTKMIQVRVGKGGTDARFFRAE